MQKLGEINCEPNKINKVRNNRNTRINQRIMEAAINTKRDRSYRRRIRTNVHHLVPSLLLLLLAPLQERTRRALVLNRLNNLITRAVDCRERGRSRNGRTLIHRRRFAYIFLSSIRNLVRSISCLTTAAEHKNTGFCPREISIPVY